MARLKLLYAGNHTSSSNIGADLENVVRYLNSAELGDKTISELMEILFDKDGTLVAPVELRNDVVEGLQYRIGTYEDPTEGWETIATPAEMRGLPGTNVGTIGAPVFSDRADFTATAGQTVFNYSHDAEDQVLVYDNGVLRAAATYTTDPAANTVTLDPAAELNDVIVMFRVQGANDSGFSRTEVVADAAQVVVPFVHSDSQNFLVYLNGVLQREGGSYDYTASAASNTVTFTGALTAGDLVTFIIVEDTDQVRVTGLMTEDKYTDANGAIPYSLIAVADAEIPAAKVDGMVDILANRGRVYVSAMTPATANAGDFWVDTSAAPNLLKFYNGAAWLLASPETAVPGFTGSNALQVIRVNSAGTALEFAGIDLSALVPKTYIGAADGVAALDATGRLPVSQLPETYATRSFFLEKAGSVTNESLKLTRAFKQIIRADAFAAKLSAGTCSIQLKVDGTAVGDVVPVTSTTTEVNFSSSIVIDASTFSKLLEIEITAASTASDLEVTLATVMTNV